MAEEESVWIQQAEGVNVLDYILNGLEAELELERELGVRSLEVDRGLLKDSVRPVTGDVPIAHTSSTPDPVRPVAGDVPIAHTPGTHFDFVFIHDRPLSPKGIEMMAKIIPAMGKTPETAPIVVATPIPQAKIYVFLGRAALNKYMAGMRVQEGVWFKSPKGKEIMLVKSPEEILRFATVTPAVKQMKENMWRALKVVMQRARM